MFLHLEISSKCTLKCPLCPRTQHPGKFAVTELSLDLLEKALGARLPYTCILLCGDHGDPIYHSRFHEVLQLIKRYYPNTKIEIATNGSFRSQEWWTRTAEILEKHDQVTFGIDGLKHTNSIYRVGADWDSIIKGICTLKEYGVASVRWQWILFKYNEDQIKEGVQWARKLGVDTFELRKSFRPTDDPRLQPSKSLESAQKEALCEN